MQRFGKQPDRIAAFVRGTQASHHVFVEFLTGEPQRLDEIVLEMLVAADEVD
jgi:hypothetical protein